MLRTNCEIAERILELIESLTDEQKKWLTEIKFEIWEGIYIYFCMGTDDRLEKQTACFFFKLRGKSGVNLHEENKKYKKWFLDKGFAKAATLKKRLKDVKMTWEIVPGGFMDPETKMVQPWHRYTPSVSAALRHDCYGNDRNGFINKIQDKVKDLKDALREMPKEKNKTNIIKERD